jgi:hypothetical protein
MNTTKDAGGSNNAAGRINFSEDNMTEIIKKKTNYSATEVLLHY